MPSARRRFANVVPTPGSVVAGSEPTRSGDVQPRGRGHRSWTTPAKPVCARVIVATGTEDRTRSGRTLDDCVLEPEEADRPRARMRTDHRAQLRRDFDLRVRTYTLDERTERVQPLRCGSVGDADLERRRIRRGPFEDRAKLLER